MLSLSGQALSRTWQVCCPLLRLGRISRPLVKSSLHRLWGIGNELWDVSYLYPITHDLLPRETLCSMPHA